MSPLDSLYKDLTGGVIVLRVIGQFMNSRILVECAPRTFDAIWLKRLSKQNSPRGSLATVVAAAMAFV